MPKRIGVYNAPPLYAIGLSAFLSSADYVLEEIIEPMTWINGQQSAAVLVTVNGSDSLDLVVELTADDTTVVLTLVDELNAETVRASLRAGAKSAIPLGGRAEDVRLALDAAMAGKSVIPDGLARTMAYRDSSGSGDSQLGEQEVSWLRDMASGITVAAIGERYGYSEREMFRRLRRLYSRMGVRSRTEALLTAERWGLLE